MPNYSPEHLNLYVTGSGKKEVEEKCGVGISNVVLEDLGVRFFLLLYAKFVALQTCFDAVSTVPCSAARSKGL